MLREPVVCGTFYPSTKDEILDAIKNSFLSPLGVGEIPNGVSKFDGIDYPINVMVPHAGYVYSGPTASYSYFEIAKNGIPDVFIILSPNHTGFGEDISIYNHGEWKTPLGNVEIDEDFANFIIEFSDIACNDFKAHEGEHSIEVQIPFLQFLSNDFKIVPITMKSQTIISANDLGQAILKASEKLGKSYCVIASTDLSHFYNQEHANKVDNFVLEDIGEMNDFKLMEDIIQYNITMCGYGPVMTTIIISKLTGKDSCELLAYNTSGDITGDFSQVVGYASAIFK